MIGDSLKWRGTTDHQHLRRTPTGRLVTVVELAGATDFLLRNSGINAHDLHVDGGMLIT